MITKADKQAAIEPWWQEWWAEDYSWQGLADKPWEGWSVTPDGKAVVETDAAPDGSLTATLQDYFRWNPDTKTMRGDAALKRFKLLEADPDGRLFHICHVPLQWENGEATWKADEDDEHQANLISEIALRIAHAAQTAFWEDAPWIVEGADRRAQLTGAVLRAAPRPPAQPDPGPDEEPAGLHLKASRLCIHGDADFNGAHFGSGADFSQAQFSGGYANFDNAQFSGGNASFRHAQFSGGYADFTYAQFSGGYASFYNAQFSGGDASFYNAQFSGGDASFINAQFSSGDAIFWYAQFSGGYADFSGTNFKTSASFHACVFLGALDLSRGDQPEFNAGHLTPKSEKGEAGPAAAYTLRLQTPEAKAVVGAFNEFDLSGALCLGPVQFDDRHFGAAPYFTETQFFDQASFHGAKLHDGLQHREWLFKFDTRAKDEFPSLDALARRVGGDEAVDALSEQLEQWRALIDAEDDPADALAAQIDAAHRNGRALRNVYRQYALLDARFQEKTADATRFEANYRRLKELMAGIGSRTEEQRFYALELKARQARTDKDVKPGEKLFAQLYGAFSDYGQSLRRPIIWIAGIWIAFALVYGGLSLSVPAPALFATPALERAAGPLVYSAEMTLAPIANPNRHHPWAQDLAERQDWRSPAFAATRLLHRVLALPLLFLFLLTLRRRFQIS